MSQLLADGPSSPRVVMGLSGKPEKLVDISRCLGLGDSPASGPTSRCTASTVVDRTAGTIAVTVGSHS